MDSAIPLQVTGAESTVDADMQKSAKEIDDATGFDLRQMLAGRRADDSYATARTPRDCHKSYGPSEWTLSRVLNTGHRMSERSLQQLAKSLFGEGMKVEHLQEVRRAYSVTVQRFEATRKGLTP